MKRILVLVLCLMMVLGNAAVLAQEAPAELTICIVRRTTDITTSYSEKHWVQELEKACNVKINWIELLEGSHAEPLTAMLAGDLPDVFWAGSIMSDAIVSQNPSLWYVLTEEEIREKVPNLAAFADQYAPDWLQYITYPDGNIYGLPGGKLHSPMHTTQGIPYINRQWLNNLGLQMPTTMDELTEVLRAFRDQDANGNGDPADEIPFDICDNFFASALINKAASWGLPLYSSGQVYYSWDENGNVVEAVNTPAYREFLEYYHGLAQEGLVNLEGLSQSYDQFASNINSGRVGLFWGWGPCNYISDSALFLQYEAMIPPAAEGYTTRMYTNNTDFANSYRNNYIITRDCENVDKALEVWNYASDPVRALDICNGEQYLFWDFVDQEGNYMGENATMEQIEACGFHYLVKLYPKTTEEEKAANNKLLTDWGYDWLVDKTYTGSNTVGLVNIAPLMVESENYSTGDLTAWGVQRYVSIENLLKPSGVFCKYFMNKNIIPADKQEEFDFMTDGLAEVIIGFAANSLMNGVTDESWNTYLNDLTSFNYSFYIDFYNNLAHNEL